MVSPNKKSDADPTSSCFTDSFSFTNVPIPLTHHRKVLFSAHWTVCLWGHHHQLNNKMCKTCASRHHVTSSKNKEYPNVQKNVAGPKRLKKSERRHLPDEFTLEKNHILQLWVSPCSFIILSNMLRNSQIPKKPQVLAAIQVIERNIQCRPCNTDTREIPNVVREK